MPFHPAPALSVALALLALAPAPPLSAGQGENALALLDAYLDDAARSEPRWRTDLRPGQGPATLAAGHYAGRGDILGPFTYRPKSYAELPAEERARLLRGEGWRRFILARRAVKPRVIRFAISAGEMLGTRPLTVDLPEP
jgi:hypothetical protein